MIKIGFKKHYRVLHFTTELGKYMIGGLTTFINEQYKYHSGDVGFVHCYHPKIFPDISIENYPGSNDIASFSMLEPEHLAELSFDIAVFHYCDYGFIADEALRRGKIVIFVIHSLVISEPYNVKNPYDFPVDGFPYYPFEDKIEFSLRYPFENMCKKANAIVCVSYAEQQKLVSIYPKLKDKTLVIYNGITIIERAIRYSIRSRRNVFGYIGRIEHRKGLLECLKAFDNIEGEFRIACGLNSPSYLRALRNYINASHLEEKVQFYGWCQGERRNSFLCSLDALIISSLYEPFGYVVLEAMNYGIPVICSSSSGGVLEIIGDYKYCFDPYQIGDLPECIRQFQEDSGTTIQMEIATLCSRLKLFSSEKMVNQYLDLYNSII